MVNIRQCEFCKDWTPEYLQEFLSPETICGACNDHKVLDIKDCFCCAYEPSECACDADWSDYVYYED